MGTVVVNGVTYRGSNISIRNGNVKVDGKAANDKKKTLTNVVVEGNVGKLQLDSGDVTISGECKGDIDAGGSIHVGGAVTGSVDAGGSVQCGDVGGDVDSGGSIKCGNVGGDVDAGGSISMLK